MLNSILIVGNAFKDSNSVPTQGELLYEHLKPHFNQVEIVSKHRAYFKRAINTIANLIGKKRGVTIFQVYGTRSLYIQFFGILISKLRRLKVISTLHGGLIPEIYKKNPLKRGLLNCIFHNSNVITVPSNFMLAELPVIKNKCVLIRNYLANENSTKNPAKQKVPDNTIKIIWIRAYHDIYNPIKAVHTVEHLLNKGQNVKMVMAGPDLGYFDKVKKYINKRNLTNHIKQLKRISQEEIDKLVEEYDIYLCTNKVDNAPVTFTEMLKRQIPIVSTNVGGIKYLVTHQKNALLAGHNTAEELAELLIQVNESDALRNKLIAGGNELMKEFASDAITNQWVNLIKQTVML